MANPSRNPFLAVMLLLVGGAAGFGWWWFTQRETPVDMVRVSELNNRGIGHMEQFDYPKATESFREIVKLAPGWLPGRINLGIALLNQHKSADFQKEAIAIFEKVLQEDSKNNHADFCLGILRNYLAHEMLNAVKHFEKVTQRDPDDPHAWFFMAGILNQLDEAQRAKECYEKVIAIDPYIPGCFNALQLLYRRQDDPKKADEFLERFKEMTKNKWESFANQKYAEMGKYAEVIGRNPRDKTPPSGLLPIFIREDKLKVQLAKDTRWAAAADLGAGSEGDLRRALRKRSGGTVVVFDCNHDGKLDLFLAGAVVRGGKSGDLLLVNDGGAAYRDITEQAGLAAPSASIGSCAADFDNDGWTDLLLTGVGGVRLLRHAAVKEVRFLDVTKMAGLDQLMGVCAGAAFADIDQDSDLDLLVAVLGGDAASALAGLQKVGDAAQGGVAVFLNVAEAPENPDPKQIVGLAPKYQRADKLLPETKQAMFTFAVSDLDTDRDIDILLFGATAVPTPVLNDRFLKFHRAALPDKLLPPGSWNGAAMLDVNRDEKTDAFVVGPGQKPGLLLQGKARSDTWFTAGVSNAPAMLQAQAVDLDLDGWTDIVGLSEEGLPVLLHNQAGKLVYVKEGLGALADWPKDVVAVIAADVDDRCQNDFFIWSEAEGLRLYRNQGNGNHGLPVQLTGKRDKGESLRTNNDAIGARVGAQVRDHWTCAELATFHAGLGQSRMRLLLGMGKADRADFVSIRWPDGVWQAELNLPTCQHAILNQKERKSISCPLLFTWDGQRFVYITDFLGAGSVGEPLPAGGNRPPRPEESVKIEAEQLMPKDGRYVLKFAEPMDEVTYLDRLRLVVVDHPADVRVYPDERFQSEMRPATQDLLAFSVDKQVFAKQAKDHRGRDVTQTLRQWDRSTADGFAKRSWIGFAEEHWVELDFGDQLAKFNPLTPGPGSPGGEGGKREPLGLFLAGWTDYPFPESIWAATQAGHALLSPVLERWGDDGKWHEVRNDLSFPAGLPRMMTYDITGLTTGPTCKLRIRTNMQVYWDQIFIAPLLERIPNGSDKANSVRLQTLDVNNAKLEHRGCVQEFLPDGKQPTVYSYDKLDAVPVTRQTGKLSKFGDVTELLTERDDRFVIFGPGDELTVTFPAEKLPQLPAGWKRSFVLRTWGYCKDASPWTATGDTIEPLPFHDMSNFPYGPGERYPQSPLHQEYLQRWQTRQIGGTK